MIMSKEGPAKNTRGRDSNKQKDNQNQNSQGDSKMVGDPAKLNDTQTQGGLSDPTKLKDNTIQGGQAREIFKEAIASQKENESHMAMENSPMVIKSPVPVDMSPKTQTAVIMDDLEDIDYVSESSLAEELTSVNGLQDTGAEIAKIIWNFQSKREESLHKRISELESTISVNCTRIDRLTKENSDTKNKLIEMMNFLIKN